MRNKFVQITMEETYTEVLTAMEDGKPELIKILEEHLDFDQLIPLSFHQTFYKRYGRTHLYHPESILKALVLQMLFGFSSDAQLLLVLNCSSELQDYCEFSNIPDASVLTRFKQNYCEQIAQMFESLVELTEPICRCINEKKADYLIYDTTGVEPYVSENNPKFMNSKLKQAKAISKKNTDFNPYKGVYGLLPQTAAANPDIHQQYVNGHYCYALKAGILTNGLGIIRGISFFDADFKNAHPEIVTKKTTNPDSDKEIADSKSLKPVLQDFFKQHPTFSYKTFLGDSAFDSYDNYTMLKNDFLFDRVCIPLNPRNRSKADHTEFDSNGTPLCPVDKTPFLFQGICKGKNRSDRFKWVCHKSVQQGNTRFCICDTPCTASSYGRCVYTYPDKEFRLYPGIPRATEHWDHLYRHRVVIERTITLFKDVFALDARKTYNTKTIKANLYLSGITQLLGVLLANSLHKLQFYKSPRKLLAA